MLGRYKISETKKELTEKQSALAIFKTWSVLIRFEAGYVVLHRYRYLNATIRTFFDGILRYKRIMFRWLEAEQRRY